MLKHKVEFILYGIRKDVNVLMAAYWYPHAQFQQELTLRWNTDNKYIWEFVHHRQTSVDAIDVYMKDKTGEWLVYNRDNFPDIDTDFNISGFFDGYMIGVD